ncbi:hypothetical protein JNL27_11945 [bacterium]|nr:hypothetical protein [bacterium]
MNPERPAGQVDLNQIVGSTDLTLKIEDPETKQKKLDHELWKSKILFVASLTISSILFVAATITSLYIIISADSTQQQKEIAEKIFSTLLGGIVGFLLGKKAN